MSHRSYRVIAPKLYSLIAYPGHGKCKCCCFGWGDGETFLGKGNCGETFGECFSGHWRSDLQDPQVGPML